MENLRYLDVGFVLVMIQMDSYYTPHEGSVGPPAVISHIFNFHTWLCNMGNVLTGTPHCVDRFIAIRENFPRGPQFAVNSGSRHLEDRDMYYVEQIRHPRSPKPLPPAGLHNIVRTSFTSSLLHLHNYTSTSDVIQDIDLITLYNNLQAPLV
ncbi:hypothetical protein BDR06DRAFT_974029 [Suillus hirtellus]|nr:hypothetical protein BDR06DRAFT_974029 [Suillus hirtellus]